MPFLPNVPHIVGDDDEEHESEVQTPKINGCNENSDQSESLDSDSSESSGSSSEDWSHNVYHIDQAPQESAPAVPAAEVEGEHVVVALPTTVEPQVVSEWTAVEQEDREFAEDATEIEEGDQQQPDMELCSPLPASDHDSQLLSMNYDRPMPVYAGDFGETPTSCREIIREFRSPEAPALEIPAAEPPCEVPPELEHLYRTPPQKGRCPLDVNKIGLELADRKDYDESTSKYPRRTLRALLHRQKRTVAPTITAIRTRRSTKVRENSQTMFASTCATPLTIGGRVAKRHVVAKNLNIYKTESPPMTTKSPKKLARPVDVTEYFSQVSSYLVSNRIALKPFLEMRDQIDSLVGFAMAETKATKTK
ncbi:hypothetical protein KR093_006232 [Drosophila rubida]|uniref:Uncharacterized protein n=1 Tax=Drosophila rubida TaxID=30044 RepID=A0AAD4PP07_9MUSC|nr:hypothetical protein KR093_006232 [Drosophila rubida]